MLQINGLQLDDPAGRWQLDSETELRTMGEITSTLITLPHRNGNLSLYDTQIGASKRAIVIQINGQNYAQMMDYRAILDAEFTRGGKLVLTETLGDGTVLNAECELISAIPTDYGIGDLSSTLMTYTLRIPTGVYQASTSSTATLTQGTNVQLAALLGGSAPIPNPVFTITPKTAGAVTFEAFPVGDPTAWIRFNYTAPNTTAITINPQDLTAVRSGTNLAGLLDVGPKPFYIPANTRLGVTLTNLTGIVEARKAWY